MIVNFVKKTTSSKKCYYIMTKSGKNITIYDLARECGVSGTTVSLALRNHPKISDKTKKRVQEAAERLNYKRNPMVSALMSSLGQSRSPSDPAPLAVVYATTSQKAKSPYQQRLWEGISSRADELGFSAERFIISRKVDIKRTSEILAARGIRGIIIPPADRSGSHLSLDWNSFSAVAIGYSMLRPNLNRICHDQYQEMRLTLKQVYSYGYKRPGLFLCPEDDLRSLYSWSSAFYGYECPRKRNKAIPPLKHNDPEKFRRWYKKHKPDVIISIENDISHLLKPIGLECPVDVGFVTLNYNRNRPEIAGIDQREDLLGATAVDHLTQLLYQNKQGIPDAPCTVLMPPRWIRGASLPKHTAE